MCIWFRHLITDWFTIRLPQLKDKPFVIKAASHGRMVVTAANALAEAQGIYCGMVLADARAITPGLEVLDDKPGLEDKLLKGIAAWCIRFTPVATVDPPAGIILDVTGCTHLWGGDQPYLEEIIKRLNEKGYDVRAAIADTIGAAWAVSRFGQQGSVVAAGNQREAIANLPPTSLRLDVTTAEMLRKLGLTQVKDFIDLPRSALRRRFGDLIPERLDQALGIKEELIVPQEPVELYHERLPCLEPIVTATGITIGLRNLLNSLCSRLKKQEKGLRVALFKCYRVDGKMQLLQVQTNSPSSSEKHLYKLFEIKLSTIEPGEGIELFVLEAPRVEDQVPAQQNLWQTMMDLNSVQLSELMDRITGRIASARIQRFLPDEHYWPERSVKPADSLRQPKTIEWTLDRPRPLLLLATPEQVIVAAPVPDYPPMLFRYKDKVHNVVKADGPERIEAEWWLQEGKHRDYYVVEDEEGKRYWLFRSGHYHEEYQWFIHGFFP